LKRNREFELNMVAQIFAFAINIGIGFLLTPYIVNSISGEAYGFVGLANNFVSYALIVTSALNSMAARFVAIEIHRNTIGEANRYFSSVVYSNLVLAFSFGVLAFLVVVNLSSFVHVSANILADVKLLWALIFLNFVISIINSIFNIATFVKNKLYLLSKQRIVSYVLKAVVLLAAFSLFSPSVWYLGLATVTGTAYLLAWNIYYTKKLMPEVKVRKAYFDWHAIKVLLSSGIWNSISSLSSILSTGLDLLFANLFIGSAAMGVLSIAKTVPMTILSLFGAMSVVYVPQLIANYARNEYETMKSQLIASMKFLGMFACIPVASLFAYGDIFYRLWVPSQDAQLLYVLSIVSCLEFTFTLPLEGLWSLFTVMNKVRQSSIFLIITSALSIVFVLIGLQFTDDPTVKLYIIAGTSTIFMIIRALTFLPLRSAHYLKLQWNTFYPYILKSIASSAATIAASFLIKRILPIDRWSMLFLAILMTSVIALLLNSVILLNKGDRAMIISRMNPGWATGGKKPRR